MGSQKHGTAAPLKLMLLGCRSVIGEADGALYVAFMGTKQRRDLVANAQVIQDPVWPEDAAAFQNSTPQASTSIEFRPAPFLRYPACLLMDLPMCLSAWNMCTLQEALSHD